MKAVHGPAGNATFVAATIGAYFSTQVPRILLSTCPTSRTVNDDPDGQGSSSIGNLRGKAKHTAIQEHKDPSAGKDTRRTQTELNINT